MADSVRKLEASGHRSTGFAVPAGLGDPFASLATPGYLVAHVQEEAFSNERGR